jgi:prepilin-type N-terminal cleavage/methylation domain-containing protein
MPRARASRCPRHGRPQSGFTLVELMITLACLAIVMVAVAVVLIGASHSKQRTEQSLEATQTARATLDMLARDVRAAGYGADLDYATPQPPIAYVDSTQIIVSENQLPFPDGSAGPTAPLAYNPASSPKPHPLVGTTWTPPTRYRTGAELIRYTLDLNDDGVVDANDLSTSAGSDARATPNPNDYVLVRQVYGDSTGGVAGSNGGVQERVALIYKPGGTVPALFTVYLKGSTTPYDWSLGPVPAAQLGNINRVVMSVTTSSTRPDARGQYPVTTMRTEVNSMHNSPNQGGVPKYSVNGYVYDDKNRNRTMDGTDVGIAGAVVQLGPSMIAYTNSSGYFQFSTPAGSYLLKHTPVTGYGSFSSPDTFMVTVSNANVSRSFADTARAGGTVTITCYMDANGNGHQDAGEAGIAGLTVTLGGATAYTDAYGAVHIFAAVGAWSAQVTLPDSLGATTANPVTGTVTNGGTAAGSVGFSVQSTGTVTGTVYKDLNKNGTIDSGEGGIAGVWVGVTNDGGVTVQNYAYTGSDGTFSITVPANDPPRTNPYTVYCVPPSGYFPTGSTATAGVYVRVNQTVSGYAFGMANYQVISLSANRVLSLESADLMEKDWNGNQTARAHGDADLVLGADAGGTDNISVWFNQAPVSGATPLFNPAADYSRLAPQSVMALALDTLDANVAPFARPDMVTGTKLNASGNLFVWFNQNSSGNEGYFPTGYSTGQNYKTSDNGDVQAVRTLDVLGGNMPDIIAGTKSSTANQGQIEIWTNSNTATPTFSRAETYSTYGALNSPIGEVNGIALADLDGDGLKDMVVVTKTGSYSGQILFFKNLGKSAAGAHFQYQNSILLNSAIATAVVTTDVNGDGVADVIVGTQSSTSSGSLLYYRNSGGFNFALGHSKAAPGIVTALRAADMGGATAVNDLVVGWRASTSNYAGGVLIYFLDVHGIPSSGVDPSGGSIVNMVPAVTAANFNYYTYPSGAPTPALIDLAVGVKSSSTAGSIVIFIR